jgi:hypothetical protein
MSRIHVETNRIVDARPEDLYAFLADYREQRPRILTPNFQQYTVLQGGRGAGTVVTYLLQAGRRERVYEMHVQEPGRATLVERDARSSLVTTWQVSPVGNSAQGRVTIVTEWEGGRGIGGFFERTFAPMGLRRVYDGMLDQLVQVLARGVSGRAAS